ncbi:MAG: hypothetical protein AAFU80_23670 [Pseudomonadota bacterium]
MAKAAAVLGLLFTAFTYANNLRLSQAERLYAETKALMEQYDTSGVRRLENVLIQRLLFYSQGGNNLNNPNHFPDKLFAAIAKETLFADTGDNGDREFRVRPFVDDLNLILDFYAQVDFCLEAEMCDGEILLGYFCPRAEEFQSRHQRLIAFYRDFEGSGDQRHELERFTDKCRTADL